MSVAKVYADAKSTIGTTSDAEQTSRSCNTNSRFHLLLCIRICFRLRVSIDFCNRTKPLHLSEKAGEIIGPFELSEEAMFPTSISAVILSTINKKMKFIGYRLSSTIWGDIPDR
jgi:hypothetical protein